MTWRTGAAKRAFPDRPPGIVTTSSTVVNRQISDREVRDEDRHAHGDRCAQGPGKVDLTVM